MDTDPFDLLAGTRLPSVEIRYRAKGTAGPFMPWIEVGNLGSYASFGVGHQMILMLRPAYKDLEFALYRSGLLLLESEQPGLPKQ